VATVEMRVDDLERGDVPAVSVKTGRPCAHPVGITLRPRARRGRVGWNAWSVSKLRVVVALEPVFVRGRRVAHVVAWLALVVAVVGAVSPSLVVALAGVGGYAVAVGAGEALGIGARRGDTADVVVLTRVHAAFAAAVSR
jgi:hypothetical protein